MGIALEATIGVFEMPNVGGPTGQELCVLYREAVAWIAVRDFNGRAAGIGPRPLKELPPFGDDSDDDVEYGISIGRIMLAQDLLLDYAAKGRIRIYASEGWTEHGAALSFPIQLTADFLTKAELDFDKYEGPTLFISEEQGYNELAVHYGDLLEEFWGAAPSIAIRETTPSLAASEQLETPAADLHSHQRDAAARAMSRRGRRPKYAWPDFSAELLRRLISEPPIANQATLEKHMQEWCAETWDAEPALSQIREWVGPAFKMFSRSSAVLRAANGAADNSSPGTADAAEG